MASVEIPNRAVFRAAEVCEIAELQPYILRSWEAEFPDLGVAKSAGAARVYRKADVEKVLRLKHLILVDGLTLAGARKQLTEEGVVAAPDAAANESVSDADLTAMMDAAARNGLKDVKRGLEWILGVLDRRAAGRAGASAAAREEFALSAPAPRATAAAMSNASRKAPAAKAPAKKAAVAAKAKSKSKK